MSTRFLLAKHRCRERGISGGLTTIEEKALGNIQKIGKRAKSVGVLMPAEPPCNKGLWFTLWLHPAPCFISFPAGQGNIVANPILPVIKLSANPLTS